MLQLDCLCLYGAFVLTCIFVSARSGSRHVPWRLSVNGVIAFVWGLGANLLTKFLFLLDSCLYIGGDSVLSGSSCFVTSAST
jgi:hypothetical protein